MVCPGGHFVGKGLQGLLCVQSRCLQPGMDHADDWCEATSDAHAHTSNTHPNAPIAPIAHSDASDAHSAAANTTHWWLRTREGL